MPLPKNYTGTPDIDLVVSEDIFNGLAPDRQEELLALGTIVLAAGQNWVFGRESGDQICTGSDNDKIGGEGGDDRIDGGAGNDVIDGGSGDDSIVGGDGNDQINGGTGNDTIWGGNGNDKIAGGGGDDVICGDAGNDTVNAGAGNDIVLGGDGADTINGQAGNDSLHGEAGFDTIDGGDGDDTISGGDGADTIKGGTGNDVISAGAGDDSVEGGDGNDSIKGGAGNDTLKGDAGNDTICGDEGEDKIWGGTGNDVLSGGNANDTIDGGDGNDRIQGNRGNDVMTGGLGADDFEFCKTESKYGEYDLIKDWNAGVVANGGAVVPLVDPDGNDQIDLCGQFDFRVVKILRTNLDGSIDPNTGFFQDDDVVVVFSTGASVGVASAPGQNAADDFLGVGVNVVEEGVGNTYGVFNPLDRALGQAWTDDFSPRKFVEADCKIVCPEVVVPVCDPEPPCWVIDEFV